MAAGDPSRSIWLTFSAERCVMKFQKVRSEVWKVSTEVWKVWTLLKVMPRPCPARLLIRKKPGPGSKCNLKLENIYFENQFKNHAQFSWPSCSNIAGIGGTKQCSLSSSSRRFETKVCALKANLHNYTYLSWNQEPL